MNKDFVSHIASLWHTILHNIKTIAKILGSVSHKHVTMIIVYISLQCTQQRNVCSWAKITHTQHVVNQVEISYCVLCSLAILDPRVGHTMDALSPFSLTLPQEVLSMFWCCPSSIQPCVVFLTCVHLALFLALSLSPGNSFVSSWCDHSMLASLLWQCPTVSSLLQLCSEPTHLFSLLSTKPAESFSVLSSQRRQDAFLHSFWQSSFHSHMLLQATLALSLVVSSLKSVCCDFSVFSALMPRSPALCLTWYRIPSYTHHLCNQGLKVKNKN